MERRYVSAAPVAPEERVGSDHPLMVGFAAVFYDAGDPGTEYELWSDGDTRCVERVLSTAFDGLLKRGVDCAALFNHDANCLLGRTSAGTLKLEKTAQGLKYTITPPDSPTAKGVVESIRRGDLRGSSFSFTVDDAGQRWVRQGGLCVRELHDLTGLYDVGPVTFPAYGSTSAGARALGDDEARRALERWQAWSCEKGAEVEVSLADARRMISRGLAEELKDAPLPKATREEVEASRVVEVATVRAHENTAVVRPLVRK